MGTLIDVENFDGIMEINRRAMIDGIIKGSGIASLVGTMLEMSIRFGFDEADREAYFFARIEVTDRDELQREAVSEAVEIMFDGGHNCMGRVVRQVTTMGAAFGFQQKKAKGI